MPRGRAHDGLIHLAEHGVEAVETLDLTLETFSLSNVPGNIQVVIDAVDFDGARADFDRESGAIFAQMHRFKQGASRFVHRRDFMKHSRARTWRLQVGHRHCLQFGQRVAVGLDRAVVGFDNLAVLVCQDDRVVGALH